MATTLPYRPAGSSMWMSGIRATFDNPLSIIGGIGCLVLIAAAIFGSLLAPYDPLAQSMLARFAPPGAGHWLGTDEFGRDVLSRLLYAARASIGISILSVFFGLLIGSVIGVIAGYRGGWVDLVIMELSNLLLAFPTIVLGIVVLVALGSGITNVIIATLGAFSLFDLVFIMTSGGPFNSTQVAMTEVYLNAFQFQRFGYASAQATVLLAIMAVVSVVLLRISRRSDAR